VRSWNRAGRPVLDGLWSAIASQLSADDDDADSANDGAGAPSPSPPPRHLLPLYADAHLALLRDAEGTARQAWCRHPDGEWRAAGRRVAEDAAKAQAQMLLAARGRAHRRLRRALSLLSQPGANGTDGASGGRRSLLCRSLVEQLDLRITSALMAEAEAEAAAAAAEEEAEDEARRRAAPAARRPPAVSLGADARRRREEEERQPGGMWQAALETQQQRKPAQQTQRPRPQNHRRELLLRLHAARRAELAAVAAVAASAAASAAAGEARLCIGPELVELEAPELVPAAHGVPGLAPYLLRVDGDEGEGQGAGSAAAAAAAAPTPPPLLVLALTPAAVRRCLSSRGEAAAPLRRLAYERGLLPWVAAAAEALPEVWRWRAEVARCVGALTAAAADGATPTPGRAAPAAAPPDAARRLASGPDAALAFLFELLDAIRPAADSAAAPCASAAPWDVEGLLLAQQRWAGDAADETEDAADEAEDAADEAEDAGAPGVAAFAELLAPHLRLGGVLRGLARASAELFGLEIAELTPGPHPSRPPDLPDHCPAFAVAVPAAAAAAAAGTRGAGDEGAPTPSPAGVFALDPCAPGEGYGTRVVRLRFPLASGPLRGPDALVPSPAHALVAIGLSLEAGAAAAGGGDWEAKGGGPLPVDDPSFMPSSSSAPGRLRLQDVEAEVLSLPALWELAHEFGHALHLLLSNERCAAGAAADADANANADADADADAEADADADAFAGTPLAGAATHHLAGRFLPSDALEVPSQLFERLMLEPLFLSRVCLAPSRSGGGGGGACLPLPAAIRLARQLRRAYASALPVQDKAVAAVAEQVCVLGAIEQQQEGGGGGVAQADGAGGAWAGARAAASSLGGVATLRQRAMLPVVARHRGTYYSYNVGWVAACALGDEALAPLVRALWGSGGGGGGGEDGDGGASGVRSAAAAQEAAAAALPLLRRRARAVLGAHAGLAPDALARALGLGPGPGLSMPPAFRPWV